MRQRGARTETESEAGARADELESTAARVRTHTLDRAMM